MKGSGHNMRLVRSAPLIGLFALTLSGCGTMQRAGISPPSNGQPAQADNWRGRENVRDAIALLNRGDPVGARRKLMTVLRQQPGDAVARSLIQQIDTDPHVLLGRENYSYTLREGETLSTVAQRALGNPMLFYALARYNDIAVPESVGPGRTILVPGRRPAPPPPRSEPRPTPSPRPTAPNVTPPRPAPPASNPAQAARLRAQGLAALNAGQIDRAVSLLRQALAQDPGSAPIRNDLNRALRIQGTVRSRR